MCGIAGYYGKHQISDERVELCLSRMRRRGPDSVGTYRKRVQDDRHLVLLHSRLSIIDLDERANQPFRVGDNVLIFNGEIYNYVELRESLLAGGSSLHTNSDTEVLAHLLADGSWPVLNQCEGMWAFALFNESSGNLLLSRDRFGEKPLYVYHTSDGVYFASEVKFIAALLGRSLSINYPQLYRYLVNGYKSLYKGRETFFEGLSEVNPGHVITIDRQGKEANHTYWTPRLVADDSMTFDEAVAGVRERLINSVKMRLRADVPLAFCMSGGVDSNSLICTAKRVFGYDVHGFTIANSDARYEEQREVQHVVDQLGLRHTSIPISTDGFLDGLAELIKQHDAPVYTITYFAQWTLMKAVAAAGYRISISGTAADELFSGYFDHHLFYLAQIHGKNGLFEESVANWRRHIAPIVRNPFLQDPERFIRKPQFRDHIFLDAEEFSSYLSHRWQEPFSEEVLNDDLLRNRMLNELFHEAVPVILHEDDLNAMYYSIENRSPFLDRALFEFAFRIPTRHLIRDGAAKAVLRSAMRGIVPDLILDNRRKVGFNAPIFSYLDVKDPAVRKYLLDDSPIFEHLRRDKIADLIEKPSLQNSASKFLFYFVNSKIFLENAAA